MQLEVVIAVGFFLLIGIETTVSWAHNLRSYEFRDTAANFALALGDLFMAAAMKAVFLLLFAFLHRNAPLDMGLAWYSWVLLVLVNDFIYYVFHRLGHRCRFMWAFHVTHHSSQKYNFSVAIRLNLFILPLHFLFMLPLALLGFRPEAILAINSVTTLYQLWVHTELVGKLGVLDRVFNTPSNHRVHHGSNPRYLDRNYGAMFIFWDHLFGTYEPEVEAPVYGLTRNVDSYNPVTLTLHEVQAMVRDVARPGPLHHRLMYLFGPPGWQPAAAPRSVRRPALRRAFLLRSPRRGARTTERSVPVPLPLRLSRYRHPPRAPRPGQKRSRARRSVDARTPPSASYRRRRPAGT